MMKIILTILFLFTFLVGQQIGSTSGVKQSGSSWNYAGITYIDTTTGTTNDIYIDIDDWFPFDQNPLVIDYDMDIGTGADSTLDGTVKINSDRIIIGTFFCNFDNQGTASPTTDSIKYTIKAYPGVYTGSSKSLANADWGSAVTLETISRVNDYFSINNVYVHATKYKHIPPEVIKLEIAPSGDADCDDSTAVFWTFRYPQIYKVADERK